MPLLPRSSLRQHRPRVSLVEEAAATAVSYLTSRERRGKTTAPDLPCLEEGGRAAGVGRREEGAGVEVAGSPVSLEREDGEGGRPNRRGLRKERE
jgi:hypothetical protein